MKIDITPVSVWTPNGVLSANKFEVRYVNYSSGGTAVADCHVWAGDVEVSASLVNVTPEQTEAWTDDAAFCAVLAENAGLTPA